MVSKKAVSLMVSYVILISIAIGLSIGVYAWLKDYTEVSPTTEQKEGVSLFLDDYELTAGLINLSLKNNGYFNVSGFIASSSNETGIAPIDLLNATGTGTEGFALGHYYFDPALKPGEIRNAVFIAEDIRVIQIQPFTLDEKGEKIMSEQAVIKQDIYRPAPECAVDGDCTADYYSSNYCNVDDDVYRDFHNFSCIVDQCIEDITPELVESCTDTCVSGSCVEDLGPIITIYTDDFETDYGNWINGNTGDDNDCWWQGASTTSSQTGPDSGAEGTIYFLYYEASTTGTSCPASVSETAFLYGPTIDFNTYKNASVTFSRHMYGTNIGTLSLELEDETGGGWSTVLWTETGDKGNQWDKYEVNLLNYKNTGQRQLRFVYVAGDSFRSDAAVDEITISNGGGFG